MRDSTFELVLELVRRRLAEATADAESEDIQKVVKTWADDWESMPPDCKDLSVEELSQAARAVLRAALLAVEQAAPPASETAQTASEFADLLR